MINPNTAPRMTSSYERVENVLVELTPNPRDFEGQTYPAEEVESDMELLDDYRNTPEYRASGERSDAKLLEKTFTDMVERDDWFGEEDAYGDDPNYLALVTFPSSDIDDTFNHIDVVCMIGNEATGHETTPFAIDLTYNTDSTKMAQKFRWKHVYGKSETAPKGISEFGDSYTARGPYGHNVLRTRPLPLKCRRGLKIPGFASAKYFEDKNSPWNPTHEKGRIDIMPRFIVGYSPDIANVLSLGMPTEEYRKKYGNMAYREKEVQYRNAKLRAKWCTLNECHEQASAIRTMLENMDNEETKWMSPEDLKKAKKQISATEAYFAKAIETATNNAWADHDPDEIAAMEYVRRDIVCQSILYYCDDTYIQKSWQ